MDNISETKSISFCFNAHFYDQLDNAVVLVSSDGNLQYYNELSAHYFQLNPSQINQFNFLKEVISLSTLQNKIYDLKFHYNATRFNFIASAQPIMHNDEQCWLLLLKQNNVSLDHLNQLDYMLMHDLKAPLRSLKGYCDMLKSMLSKNNYEHFERIINTIDKNANTMEELLNELHQYTLLHSHNINLEEVDLGEIFQERFSYFQKKYDRQLQLVIEETPPIQADRHLMINLIHHLLSNAFKATMNNEKGVIKVYTTVNNDKITYFVEDNGIGFNMQQKEKLFMLYQKLHTKKVFPGLGVGLPRVLKIMDLHHGMIDAESEVGVFSKFWFRI